MKTEAVPIREWSDTVTRLTRRHQESPVSLLVLDADGVAHTESKGHVLQGISLDKAQRPATVSIVVTGEDGHVERCVHDPVAMEVARADDGADHALSIKSADGETTVVRFDVSLLSA